jgi:hypothetical protein
MGLIVQYEIPLMAGPCPVQVRNGNTTAHAAFSMRTIARSRQSSIDPTNLQPKMLIRRRRVQREGLALFSLCLTLCLDVYRSISRRMMLDMHDNGTNFRREAPAEQIF